MNKRIKDFLKGGMFITIGNQSVELPFDPVFFNASSLSGRIGDILQIFLIFSSVFGVGMIIVAAYMYITAAGDPEKIEGAQKTLTAAIVGLVIVWVAAIIVGFVLQGIGYK